MVLMIILGTGFAVASSYSGPRRSNAAVPSTFPAVE
jgi:hypothetical protein